MRLPSFARFFGVAFFAALVFVFVASGCGRSSLEIEPPPEAGVTPGACTAATCPNGCCDTSGQCRTGADVRACGGGGQRCSDCIATGFQTCDPARKTCSRTVAECNASTCRDGCCSFNGTQQTCLAGTDAIACGRAGSVCVDCANLGRACDASTRTCGTGKCDATNCDGCCVGDKCLTGTEATACGVNGQSCTSCAQQGQTCRSLPGGGGTCQGTPTCGPQNCGGCCQGTTCVTGSDASACGRQGAACTNCTATGRVCGADRTCQTPVTCGPANCPGCCVGNNCVVATTPAACGKGGEVCRGCGANESCNAGVCVPAPNCGPANCAGCCIGNDVCAVGSQNTACGVGGLQCANCAGNGQVCQGGTCQAAACGPANCAGCCAGNTCVIGTQDNACGGNGAQCSDCTPGNQVCQGRQCRARCSPANCAGCCTGGNACALGFTNGACGSGGAACSNCAAAGSTCNTLVVPRVCANQGGNCPAAYPACPAGVTSPVTPSLQGVCADLDLDALQAACAAGPDVATCVAAFQVLAATSPGCNACLAPFNQPFQQLSGIYTCAAPFVSAACNRATGCAVDCATTSCTQCPAASQDQCVNQVNGGGGQCSPFVQQTACVLPTLQPGNLCSPVTYGGSFGGWLRAVGDHFCGNGP